MNTTIIKPSVLMVATMSYAGMGPYVTTIVNSFCPDDNIDFILVENNLPDYENNVKQVIKKRAIIIREHNNKLTAIKFLIYPSHKISSAVKYAVRNNKYDIVHFITPLSDPRLLKWLNRTGVRVIGTIHDLHPHDSAKSFFKQLRQNTIYGRERRCYEDTKYLLTNSKAQYEELKSIYPHKQLFYIGFPTLVTEIIANGNSTVPEIEGLSNYILFFGRIEEYKGIIYLIEAFKEIQKSQAKPLKLVIAGKGNLPNLESRRDILHINRYLYDSEIASLYRNAMCVVYPYTSATQSGVLSIASFFKTPIITSDIPFFKETLGDDYPFFFRSKDFHDLQRLLTECINNSFNRMRQISEDIYLNCYSQEKQRTELINLYNIVSNL